MDAILALVMIVVTFLVVQGLKALSQMFGQDLSGIAAAVVAVIMGAILFLLNTLFALVAPAWRPVVEASVLIAIIGLGAFGAHYVYKRMAVSADGVK